MRCAVAISFFRYTLCACFSFSTLALFLSLFSLFSLLLSYFHFHYLHFLRRLYVRHFRGAPPYMIDAFRRHYFFNIIRCRYFFDADGFLSEPPIAFITIAKCFADYANIFFLRSYCPPSPSSFPPFFMLDARARCRFCACFQLRVVFAIFASLIIFIILHYCFAIIFSPLLFFDIIAFLSFISSIFFSFLRNVFYRCFLPLHYAFLFFAI